MNPKSTFYKFVNVAVVAVMLWNIVGWLGFGLMLNHTHKHIEGSHCEIALCTCEVEEGEKICTCHHQDYWNDSEHDGESHGSFCYFTNPHSNSGNSLQILIPITHFNAAEFDDTIQWSPPYFDEYQINDLFQLSTGVISDLLRPPRA